MPNLQGVSTKGEIALKSAARSFFFLVIGALYTQQTAKSDSTLADYERAVLAAFVAALAKGGFSFFTATNVTVQR